MMELIVAVDVVFFLVRLTADAERKSRYESQAERAI